MKVVSFPSGRSLCRFAKLLKNISLPAVAMIAAVALAPITGQATPYASSLTNAGGIISFRLNESADNVYVISDGGATTNQLGPMSAGLQNVALSISGTYQVAVFKASPAGFATAVSPNSGAILQISPNTQLTRFNSPRGITVNNDPASPYFGRVYVANSAPGTVTSNAFGNGRSLGDGIHMLNPDFTDAIGQAGVAKTAGLSNTFFGPGGAASPYRLSIGKDNNLYITDWSDPSGSLLVADGDVSDASGLNVLGGDIGGPNPVGPTRYHGSIAAAVVEGSLAGGNLVAYVIDEDLGTSQTVSNANAKNTLWRHDIGAALPGPTTLPTRIGTTTPWINFASQTMGLARGTNGYFYVSDNRSTGSDRGGLYVLNENGVVLWDSLTVSRAFLNNGSANDLLRAAGGVAVSPDQRFVALINFETNGLVVLPMVDGIPDITNRLYWTFGAATANGRDLAFDAANNLYAVSSGLAALRAWSPGGTATTITGSDGTFAVVRPPALSVSAMDDFASENGPDTATFTIASSVPVSEDTTVTYTLTGTAPNGTDYVTDTLSTIIPAGFTSVDVIITPIDDTEAELTESVTITLLGSATYDLQSPVSATAHIVDNELPNIITITAVDANAYESHPADIISFRLTRYGETNASPVVTFDCNAGTALIGTDFVISNGLLFGTSPDATAVFWNPGVVTEDFTIHPINNSLAEGTKSVGMMLTEGGDALPGTPSVAFGTLRDDENFPACVLYSEDFEADHSASWTTLFAATNGVSDATVSWSYDYSLWGIPAAPSSSGFTTRGLYVTVNKADAIVAPAGINFYPSGQNFSGNYALRFDLYLSYGNLAQTEHALAGLNHSGTLTNWVSQNPNNALQSSGNDGLFAAINSSGGNLRDYALYTATNTASVPALLVDRNSATLASLAPAPPYGFAGSLGNASNSLNRTWAAVELRQLDGKVSLIVNATNVIERTNDTVFQDGNVMIGYNDQFGSVGSVQNFAIFDNVRVISLDFVIKNFTRNGNTIDFDFYSPLGGKLSDFHLQTATNLVPGDWVDDNSATIFEIPGAFHVTTTASGDVRFFKMRR